jgi:hypothetical protein
MNDRLELSTRPRPIVFDLLDLSSMDVFEDPVRGRWISYDSMLG